MSNRRDFIAIDAPFEVRAAAEGEGSKLPTFTMIGYSGGVMTPGGFGGTPVVVSLAGMQIPSQTIPIRFNHDVQSGVGHTTRVAVDGGQLVADGIISRGTPAAAEVVAASKNGFPWQASIGASVLEETYIARDETAKVNGQTFEGPLYVIEKSLLKEISVVELGADMQTKTEIAAKDGGDNANKHGDADMSKKTADSGDKATADAVIAGADTNKIEAKADPAIEAKPSGDDIVAAAISAVAEENRKGKIAEIAAGYAANNYGTEKGFTLLANAAIETGKSAADFDAECKEFVASSMPGVGGPRADRIEKGLTNDVLAAAMCQATSLPKIGEAFDADVLATAQKTFRGSLGIRDAINLAARANGYRDSGFSSDVTPESLRAASPATYSLEASAGTVSLPNILANTANKFMWAGFNSVESSWRAISAVRAVRDFKQISTNALTGNMNFEEIGPNGEIKYGSVGERSYTNQAKTYAKGFGLSRTDIVNDDLGAFTRLGMNIGRGAMLGLNTIFWTEFMNNSAFFASGNANFLDGSTSALGISSLTAAETAFRNQTDPDGNPLGVNPEIILVPNALSVTGREIVGSTETRDTTSSKKSGTFNPHAGNFRVVQSSYLSNSAITGNSALAWYLLANPADMPTIEVVFLNGRQRPTVETADADFSQLGVQMRGYFDFGVEKQEFRGGVKSKGEA